MPRDADTATSRSAAARKGNAGSYRRKVAPGALALKEAAQARYLADMRAHFDEVRSWTSVATVTAKPLLLRHCSDPDRGHWHAAALGTILLLPYCVQISECSDNGLPCR